MIESAVLLKEVLGEAAHPLIGELEDYDPLMKMIGDSPLVFDWRGDTWHS
jgi:hypothetical protein